jgi:hypothetical protein
MVSVWVLGDGRWARRLVVVVMVVVMGVEVGVGWEDHLL